MFQPNESLQQAEQWQTQDSKIVARLADGREIRQVNENRCEVTTYKGTPATNAELQTQIEKLRRNYTMMDADFFAILTNELIKVQWPAKRVADAVTSVMRTKSGGFLSVADILSYDKPMKLYNYSGYCWLIHNHRAKDDADKEKSDFGMIKVDGKVFWYLKKDLPK